jgi:hypothetical protein
LDAWSHLVLLARASSQKLEEDPVKELLVTMQHIIELAISFWRSTRR